MRTVVKQSLNRLAFHYFIGSARLIHENVGCAMRTVGLKGAHGAPYDLANNHE